MSKFETLSIKDFIQKYSMFLDLNHKGEINWKLVFNQYQALINTNIDGSEDLSEDRLRIFYSNIKSICEETNFVMDSISKYNSGDEWRKQFGETLDTANRDKALEFIRTISLDGSYIIEKTSDQPISNMVMGYVIASPDSLQIPGDEWKNKSKDGARDIFGRTIYDKGDLVLVQYNTAISVYGQEFLLTNSIIAKINKQNDK